MKPTSQNVMVAAEDIANNANPMDISSTIRTSAQAKNISQK